MSSLIVSNLSDGTLSIPTTFVTNGSAKAWVNFDGTGTIAVRDSLNLSSLTDNGTGDYTVNFSSAMDNVNFSSNATCSGNGGGELRCATGLQALFAASSCRFQTTSSNGTLADVNGVYVSVHGDLA
jgi:hypothetical protein